MDKFNDVEEKAQVNYAHSKLVMQFIYYNTDEEQCARNITDVVVFINELLQCG